MNSPCIIILTLIEANFICAEDRTLMSAICSM